MSVNEGPLPDASDIGLTISLLRRATPQWLIYDAKLGGENVVAWRYLPAHLRPSEDGSALWPKLPDWVVAGELASDQTGMVPRLAAYSHTSTSGWLVYPMTARALEKPLTDRKKLSDLANNLLSSLEQLHRRDTLHLDVHPSNIRESGGRFVLAGLGLDVRKQAGAATGSNEGLARKNYSPPELWDASGRSKLGPWTDIFSAAATLYFAICGTPPADFRERIGRPRWAEAVAFDLNRELAKSGAAWPKMVDFIVAGLAPKMEDRPKSVSEWIAVWKAPVSKAASARLSSEPQQNEQDAQMAMDAKPSMLRNLMMLGGGVVAGGILFLLYAAYAIPAAALAFGMISESGSILPPYAPPVFLLALQIALVLAIDSFVPRLNMYARVGLLLPLVLVALLLSIQNWGYLFNWANIAATALLIASLGTTRSSAQQAFYRYGTVVIVVALAMLYMKIFSYDDFLLWLE